MITIQEILGTDSIAGSRLTINSNFLLLENEINDLENTFNINVVTGSMDVSQATSGQVKTKSFYSNQATFPSSGTANIILYGTGASAGGATFSGTVTSSQISVSGTGTFNGINATGSSTLGVTQFSGDATFNSAIISGLSGSHQEKNAIGASGPTNAFAPPASGGGGIIGTYSNPYSLNFTESVIYANCGYTSGLGADSGNPTGFFFSVVAGDGGAVAPSVPQGFRLTIINTSSSAGKIATGVISGTNIYYTGFNTSVASYDPGGIITPASIPYRASLTLQWENRINKLGATQKGSWVVVSSTGFAPGDI